MKKLGIVTLFIAAVACSSPSGNLAQKKAKLKKMQGKLSTLKTNIKTLKAEIAKLDTSKHGDAAVPVDVTTLKPQKFIHYVEVQGLVASDHNISVSPQTGGTVEKIYVEEGTSVKKGQTLIQINGKIIKKQIDAVKASLDFATKLYDKQKALWEKNIGSEVQYLSAKNKKESLEKNLATLQQQYALTTITSPIDGVVDEVDTKLGELVAPGMPVVRVVNLSKFKVEAQVAESYADKIKKGNNVEIFLPDINKTIKSRISYAGGIINPVDRTFSVEIELGKVPDVIKPNMIAVLKIEDYHADSALVIPINSVQYDENETFVTIAQPDNNQFVARKTKIQLGQSYNGFAMVKEGLKMGENLITFGFEDLADGEAVKFKK